MSNELTNTGRILIYQNEKGLFCRRYHLDDAAHHG